MEGHICQSKICNKKENFHCFSTNRMISSSTLEIKEVPQEINVLAYSQLCDLTCMMEHFLNPMDLSDVSIW